MIIEKILKNAIKDKIRSFTPSNIQAPKAALIFGVGSLNGIGGAVAQRIAKVGVKVYLSGRNLEKITATAQSINGQGFDAVAIKVDVTQESQIKAAFDQVMREGYAIDLVVFNVGTNRPGSFLDITATSLEQSWRSDCLSGFFVGQHAINAMQPNGQGTLIFTGASASLRGKSGFADFSSTKAGLRSLVQSMAREFGPKGIHVAHVIVDGMVAGDRLRDRAPTLLDNTETQSYLKPEDIAETYWQIYQQHRTAWTHEIDLRPSKEAW